MNLFNKYEAAGIFLSVAIMAIALSIIHFKSDSFALGTSVKPDTQTALISVTQTDSEDSDGKVEKALLDASTIDGKLEKLVIDDVRIGTGAAVKTGDTLTVQYVGRTRDGVEFDSSYTRGEPFTFTVGEGKVIQGWEKGLIGMKVGGQRILVIPSDMAYGNMQVGAIQPNSPLVFTVELLGIK